MISFSGKYVCPSYPDPCRCHLTGWRFSHVPQKREQVPQREEVQKGD